MPSGNIFSYCILALGLLSSIEGAAADDITLDNVVAPRPNQADEPIAKEASLEKAVHFLDSAALTWQKDRMWTVQKKTAVSVGSSAIGRRWNQTIITA
ncbi:MAG TPA: hypothetical protein PK992_16010 [Planctomycetaceae bacterium]|nr:hypothetical protein [Planctomycetaceae bacterium]HRA89592.1 hypothetical protein [Planctomycetaceae bacterium]